MPVTKTNNYSKKNVFIPEIIVYTMIYSFWTGAEPRPTVITALKYIDENID